MTEKMNTNHPGAFEKARAIIINGGIIAFPTDTVYGIGVSLFNQIAIEQLYIAKVRNPLKAIAVLIGDYNHLELLAETIPPDAIRLAERFWPGALTIVIPGKSDLPENLSPTINIGVRMPDHPFALELLRKLGPLATTSANLSGGKDPQTAQEVIQQLEGRIELVLDGGKTPGGIPSTVVDCSKENPEILREGGIPVSEIFKTLG